MSELVERLRADAEWAGSDACANTLREAAARIEELERALAESEKYRMEWLLQSETLERTNAELAGALRGAWEMLSAICESDPSRDRIKARDRAAETLSRVGGVEAGNG